MTQFEIVLLILVGALCIVVAALLAALYRLRRRVWEQVPETVISTAPGQPNIVRHAPSPPSSPRPGKPLSQPPTPKAARLPPRINVPQDFEAIGPTNGRQGTTNGVLSPQALSVVSPGVVRSRRSSTSSAVQLSISMASAAPLLDGDAARNPLRSPSTRRASITSFSSDINTFNTPLATPLATKPITDPLAMLNSPLRADQFDFTFASRQQQRAETPVQQGSDCVPRPSGSPVLLCPQLPPVDATTSLVWSAPAFRLFHDKQPEVATVRAWQASVVSPAKPDSETAVRSGSSPCIEAEEPEPKVDVVQPFSWLNSPSGEEDLNTDLVFEKAPYGTGNRVTPDGELFDNPDRFRELESEVQQLRQVRDQLMGLLNQRNPRRNSTPRNGRRRSVTTRARSPSRTPGLRRREVVPPPVGMVALIFTDVQSSTWFWNMHTMAMRAAMRVHNATLRAWLRHYRGYEVKTEGDAFMIATSIATDAVSFCAQTQLQLLRVDWPNEILQCAEGCEVNGSESCISSDNVPDQAQTSYPLWRGLRVRMGVHWGSVFHEQDPTSLRMDYFGPEVNRAARIASKGRGGEILVSNAAYREIEDFLPDGLIPEGVVTWPLGELQLKGFESSEDNIAYRLLPLPLQNREFEGDPPGLEVLLSGLDASDGPLPPPPLGCVCVVFSAVHTPPELWSVRREGLEQALCLHNQLLREQAHAFGGYEVKAEGDNMMLAFASPTAAAAFGMATQLALLDSSWPPALLEVGEFLPVAIPEHLSALSASISGEHNRRIALRGARTTSCKWLWRGLRVQIGIHFGVPEAHCDTKTGHMDYFGPVVSRGAQICSWARGGEVLVSPEAAAHIEDSVSSMIGDDVLLQEASLPVHLGRIYRVLPRLLEPRVSDFSLPRSGPSTLKFDPQPLAEGPVSRPASADNESVLLIPRIPRPTPSRTHRLVRLLASLECALMEKEDLPEYVGNSSLLSLSGSNQPETQRRERLRRRRSDALRRLEQDLACEAEEETSVPSVGTPRNRLEESGVRPDIAARVTAFADRMRQQKRLSLST
eukprot:TRINITY_DN41070_c0_g1_i1.p1 TRINITY_DN41070_c0_g1~~TRINITY_DN41070_c0_g1_i1.p1  ORF type:complete len:1045 (+),score=103.16 TRINITY_DN41070_c0_g1_i1:54-3188(+)